MSTITSSVSRLSRGDKYREHRREHNQCNAQYDAWSWHGNMLRFELMQLTTIKMKLVWTLGWNSNSICVGLNAIYMICAKQQLYVVLTCMKMVQMDSLNFSDNFSYINYLIWVTVNFVWILEVYTTFWNFLIYFKSRKSFNATAWHHLDISRSTGRLQVKPDLWDPYVSVTG